MKKQTLFPVLFATVLIFIASCNSNPTADEYLKDEKQRKEIVHAMLHHQPYMTEMMDEMMKNDSCKMMMMDNMMEDPSLKTMHMDRMMGMSQNDSTMFKMMIGKTMEMCSADRSKCRMMIGAIQSHPAVTTSIEETYGMHNMKK